MTQNSSDSVLEAVRALLPAIAASAAEVDRTGRVDPGVIAELHDVGYFALLQPRSAGGLEAEPDDFLSITRELSSVCMSTGWLAGWLGVNNWGLALRDSQAQEDIWGSDTRRLLCSSYAPMGRMEPVDGGYWVSGRWNRCTGAQHASWLNAAALLLGPDGGAQDFVAILVPSTDYVVEPTWNGLGLRGIGADDVVISGAFVPAYRTFNWLDLTYYANVSPVYRLPHPTLYTLAGTIPLLGAAQGLLSTRQDGDPDHYEALDPVAMARADVELSVLQIRRNLGELMGCLRAESYPDNELILRTRRDQVMASERATNAIRTIVRSPSQDRDDALRERVWRDTQTARMHVASNVDQVLSVVGRHALGLNVDELIW